MIWGDLADFALLCIALLALGRVYRLERWVRAMDRMLYFGDPEGLSPKQLDGWGEWSRQRRSHGELEEMEGGGA